MCTIAVQRSPFFYLEKKALDQDPSETYLGNPNWVRSFVSETPCDLEENSDWECDALSLSFPLPRIAHETGRFSGASTSSQDRHCLRSLRDAAP